MPPLFPFHMRRPNMQAMEIVYSFNHYTESWIEVSSQPSTSPLSSTSTEDIVTTGLQVQHYPNPNRRRRFSRNGYRPRGGSARRGIVIGGSQDEYEESESESDRFLSSSSEGLVPQISPYDSPAPPASSTSEDASSDVEDDENSTALGTTTNHNQSFIPQPNAFSHPPQSRSAGCSPPSDTGNLYNSNSRAASRQPGSSSSGQRPRGHTPYNMISPNHQVDHDAALRASLSTLLSCAAAARGLPKRDQSAPNATRKINRTDPVTVRMVSESALMGEETNGRRPAARRNSTASSTKSLSDKGKRKASALKDRREPSKKRRGSGEEITPTLMTWVVSAGVVVLFSVIGFSAGYAIGREVGRMEAGSLSAADGGVIAGGKELGRGLRRLRWGSTSTLVTV